MRDAPEVDVEIIALLAAHVAALFSAVTGADLDRARLPRLVQVPDAVCSVALWDPGGVVRQRLETEDGLGDLPCDTPRTG